MSASSFQPKIIVFCCNWCSYAGADLAGVGRLQMNPNFRVIRTMCSARIDPQFVLEAFRDGADGVMVAGCHPGDCHYIGGNYKTRKRYFLLKKMLKQLGVEEERFELQWVSAAESKKFQDVINAFCERVEKLGKLNLALD
jgi:F420-non-reducing hydrogenase iron-sulfur subunit